MSSISAITSAISRLCGSAAMCGESVDGTCRAKTGINVASTSLVRSADAVASHVVRAWLRLVAPFSSYAVRSIGANRENLRAHRRRFYPPAPARAASFDIDRAVERAHPRTSVHSPRSRCSRISHRPIPSSRRTPHRRKNLTPIQGSDHPNNRSPRSICRRLVGAGISVRQRLPKRPPDAPATHDDLHSDLVSARHAHMPTTNINVPSRLKLQRFETIFQIPALSRTINGSGIGPISQPLAQWPAWLPNLGV
ncbi:hypothetical protein BTP_272 [Burkholderia thailandensis Phuket 4W-1]|nr:hypothetical protein BTQ_2354 [Burkholderia thailandensis 2002721723]AIP25129.1 hypothetical protein DR63_767 [Burkholderia thailandensis E264]AJX98880.1 hypothetical protein BG87_1465 [Burkholderia thailandensis 2002721643]KIS57964.1 hypothetical protein BTP_272 [Burkholderia thailandensis Phuket 4W-1]